MKKTLSRLRAWLPGAALLAAAIFSGCGEDSPNANVEAGLARLRDGDYRDAVKRLEKAAVQLPADPTVQCNLGIAYWKLGEMQKAVETLKTAVDMDETDPRPAEFLGHVLLEAGNRDEARNAFDKAFRRGGGNPRVLTALAVVEINAQRRALAQVFLKQALEMDPKYAPALYNMAVLYRDTHEKPEEAATYFQRYLEVAGKNPHADVARRFLAQTEREGQVREPAAGGRKPGEEGEEIAGTAPGRKPKPSDAFVSAATNAIARVAYDEALEQLKEAIREYPEDPDPLWWLAVLYDEHMHFTDKATQTYQRFKQLFPDDPRSKQKDASESFRKRTGTRVVPARGASGGFRPAREAFSRGVKLHNAPNPDLDGAIGAYKEALQIDGNFAEAAYNLGLAYKTRGRLTESRDAFNTALKIKPEMTEASYMLAVVHSTLNENSKAIELLNGIVRREPGYSRAYFLLGRIYRDAKRYDEARRNLERFVQLAPDSPLAGEAKTWLDSDKKRRTRNVR